MIVPTENSEMKYITEKMTKKKHTPTLIACASACSHSSFFWCHLSVSVHFVVAVAVDPNHF